MYYFKNINVKHYTRGNITVIYIFFLLNFNILIPIRDLLLDFKLVFKLK